MDFEYFLTVSLASLDSETEDLPRSNNPGSKFGPFYKKNLGNLHKSFMQGTGRPNGDVTKLITVTSYTCDGSE